MGYLAHLKQAYGGQEELRHLIRGMIPLCDWQTLLRRRLPYFDTSRTVRRTGPWRFHMDAVVNSGFLKIFNESVDQ